MSVENATAPTPPTAPTAPVLQAVALSKSFKTPRGPLAVLSGVTLSVAAGEFVSVRGESGAGKTTLLQILGGLESADEGELHWNGEQVSGRSNAFLANRRARWLGYVFQSYHLVPELTALENITLAGRIAGRPLRETQAAAVALLGRVGLSERAGHLPGQLSGGECQRVALARALVNRPRLVLADEPTGNLDERTGAEIMAVLLDLAKSEGVALVLVTHNVEFARRAPRQLVLRHGSLHDASASA
ncbi:MAG: ABC transporter ATP-binding protein [Puniceicoccales bacterium]|jgi:predicted ABC-type transport system involved in lysophospholipase L1 biosynthesis ATPase subunit|nr:ABC transporter ATP-binding protein [Puniceicoccales bacterium]